MNYGLFIGRAGDWQTELEKHEQALEIGKNLIQSKREAEDLHICGSALLNCGSVKLKREAFREQSSEQQEAQQFDYTAAAADFEAAADVYRELTKDYPAVVVCSDRLSAIIGNLMGCYENYPERFISLGEEAIAVRRQMTVEFPDNAGYHRAYAGALSNVASLLQRNNIELERAALLIRQAIEQQRLALESRPDDPLSTQYLVNHHIVLAEIVIAQNGKPDDVIGVCEHGREIAERFRQKYPNN